MHYRKLYLLAAILAVALAALGYRLFDLQVLRHGEFHALAERNTCRFIERDPVRGRILDSRGNPLATSVPAKVICADPTLLGEKRADIARALAPLLETNEAYVMERLAPRLRSDTVDAVSLVTGCPDDFLAKNIPITDYKTNSYVVLKRKVPVETWEKIEETMTNLTFGTDGRKLTRTEASFFRNLRKSVFAEDDQVRVYPNKALAAHVIGYVGTDDLQTGMNGIEAVFNSKLAGVRGWRRTETDFRNREIVAYRDQDVEPCNGLNVVLTIDAGLQHIVETELAGGMKTNSPISISCTVVRPKTGEILAMATLPNYDPNRPQDYAKCMEVMRNRVISDVAEPGSTFKIVVVSGALNDHVVGLSQIFDCEHGHFGFAGRVLHDHEPYGLLSVENIITKSSNIGAAKVGIQLGEDRLYSYIRNYGFGSQSGIPLPGEVWGIVHSVKNWSKVSIAQIPMGQGIAVTPLQTVLAMSAIANKGLLMKPMLVDRLTDENGRTVAQYQPTAVRQVISEEAAKDMVTALKTVPAKGGTAELARMENYTVAGKTGTAQKAEHGVYVQKFFTSFIGFFPADNPELCISVVMDAPQGGHFGGKLAAPIFKAIAQQAANYLNIKPDIAPEVQPESGLPEKPMATLATFGAGAGQEKKQ